MTTALVADHLPLPAIRVNDPLGAIDALDAVEAFVLAAVCLRVELGLARLDMATMRRLMVERGLRPAQLIVAGDRPLEMLNALGGPSPQYEALNAILTAAVLRYGSNLPESERPAWFTWIRFQLDRLAEQTPFRLVATLPEGLMLHPDARAQQAMLKQLHHSAAPEPSSPTSVLQALDAALAPLLPPPRPVPTAHLAILSQAPGNQVISVSRPVLPPPAHRDAIRREATLAVFEAVVGPLRLRRISTPVKAPLESVELPHPKLVPVGLTRLDVEPVDVPESLTTIPTSPDPLPSLEPEPTPLARLGIATAMLKSIEPGSDGQQHNTTQERDSEWASPSLAEGIELPELLPELLELAEESRIQEEGNATPVPGREVLGERAIPATAAMPDASSSTLGVVSLSGEEGSRDVHVGYPADDVFKDEDSADKNKYIDDHDPHMDLRSSHTTPQLRSPSEAEPEVEFACAKPVLAGLGEHGVVEDDAPSGVEDVVLPVGRLPLDEAAPGLVESQTEAEQACVDVKVDGVEDVAPPVEHLAPNEAVSGLETSAEAEETADEGAHVEINTLALLLVQTALEQAPRHFALVQQPLCKATVGHGTFRYVLPSRVWTLTALRLNRSLSEPVAAAASLKSEGRLWDNEALSDSGLREQTFVEEVWTRAPVAERSFFDRDDAPLLPPESLGALSGMVGVGFGLFVILEAVLVGNVVWMAFGLVLTASLLTLDFVLSRGR